MNSKSSNKSFALLMVVVIFLLIGLIVLGYVIFFNRKPDITIEEENGADIIVNYANDVSGLSIKNLEKTKDDIGIENLKDGEYFDFSVEVLLDNAEKVEYEISVVKDEMNSTIPDEDIRIYLEKEKEGTYTKVFGPSEFKGIKSKSKFGSEKGSMPLVSVKKTNSNVDNYRLRIWLSSTASLDKGSYAVDIEVNGIAK